MEILNGLLPSAANYRAGRSADIKYIVIHYTANKGDTASNNVKYFHNNIVKASAHYFVDEAYIYTSVPEWDTAWHCGGGLQGRGGHNWYGICTNSNSIGIEMCLLDKSGDVRKGTMLKAVELVKYLMRKYNVPRENVIRHWDVTGKACPAPMTGDDNAYWLDFKNRIGEDTDMDYRYYDDAIEAIQKESNRKNEIIDMMGQEIQELFKRVQVLEDERK